MNDRPVSGIAISPLNGRIWVETVKDRGPLRRALSSI